jgi:hypothetical protein
MVKFPIIAIIESMDVNVIIFADKCSTGNIGIQAIGWAQGPFCSVQLFSDWPHQTQRCAAGLLQPVP